MRDDGEPTATTLGYQQQALDALSGLLLQTQQEHLPLIAWTIPETTTGPMLVGECTTTDPVQRRNDFERWVEVLGATAWPGGIYRDRNLHLSATAPDHRGVAITIMANIADDER